MWQVLFAAVVAGSTGYATKHFLTHHYNQPQLPRTVDNSDDNDDNLQDPDTVSESGSGSNSRARDGDGVFTFSSSQGGSSLSRPKKSRGVSRNRVRVPKGAHRSSEEVRSSGRRIPFCLKKRKMSKNSAAKAGFSSFRDNSLFGWGLGFGILYMMSAGKAEINNLNKSMDEAAKVVRELKSELSRRKLSCAHQIPDSVGNIDMNSSKMSGRHNELILRKTNSELRNTDVKIWSPALNDGGECGSSTLTEEPRVLEMDQLEAELEFELQKLSACNTDSPCQDEIRPKLDESEGCHETHDPDFNYTVSHGVSPFELNQKLSHLLIKQQDSHIAKLESELNLAQSNLQQKEAELQSLKDCVRRLTELSLSTVSDDETQALTDPKGTSDRDNNGMDSESKQTVVGVKRPIDSEPCSYYM